MRLRLPLNLALAAVAALACCAPAVASTTGWRTSTVSDAVDYATVGIDGAGSVTALFTEDAKKQIMLSRAGPHGEFSDPVPFTPECSFGPRIVGNEAGDAIALWQEYAGHPDCEGTPPVVGFRIREAGEDFGPTQNLPGAGGPNVAMNSSEWRGV